MVSIYSLNVSSSIANFITGWWLGRRQDNSASGWTPAAYLEEVRAPPPPPPAPAAAARPPPPPAPAVAKANGAPAVKAKPTPPAPPAKRPVRGKPSAADTPRDSGYSNGGTPNGSGAVTPSGQGGGGGPSLAGNLADLLKARQKAMGNDDDANKDW
jgi:myosin I